MDDADRQRFVETLGEVCAKTGWQVPAYVLMPNHFDWVVETPLPNLVAGMKWLLGTDTSRFNRRHRLFGHLFCGRYKSLIVDGSGRGYLKKRGRLRPIDSGASETGGSGSALAELCLKQLAGVLARALETSGVVGGDRLLSEWDIPEDSPAGRQRLERALEERRRAEEGDEFKPIRRDWCLGEEKFREELLTQMIERMGAEHYGALAGGDGGGAGRTNHRGGVEAGAVAGS
jgi:hypothetical protein